MIWYILTLLLCLTALATANTFLTHGKRSIESMEFGETMKQHKFWKDWFHEFTEKSQDGSACTTDGFFGDALSCQKFYRCQWIPETGSFRKYDFNCESGAIFDIETNQCSRSNTTKTFPGCSGSSGQEKNDYEKAAGFETDKFCIYDLHMSYIYASPDGVLKRIIGFNGQFPGPKLTCAREKYMVVRISNSIEDEPTSIHFHGIEQNLSPWFDGPESITQCPIIIGTSMIYFFQLFQSGTYWYHSHHSYQYVDGAWGFLVVRNVPVEVWQTAYDLETTISVNDWVHRPASNVSQVYLTEGNFPDSNSSLINARGTFPCDLVESGQICNSKLQGPAVIEVQRGKRYRLRVLNASGARQYNISIDNHKLVVIETDGVDTELSPSVDIVQLLPAHRYSFLVTMDQPLNEYWLRINGEGPYDSYAGGLMGLAVLRYIDTKTTVSLMNTAAKADSTLLPTAGALQGRPHHQPIPYNDMVSRGGVKQATREELHAFFLAPLPPIASRQKAIEFEQIAKLKAVTLPTTTAVDPITAIVLDQMTCPPYAPVGENGDAPAYYDQLVVITVEDCILPGQPVRQCMNGVPFTPGAINSLPLLFQVINGNTNIAESFRPIYTNSLNKVIRLVINNRHLFPHPWHLHGHSFWVLGNGPWYAGDYDDARDATSLTVTGVRRDTSWTWGQSWAVFTYITGNPGTWFFHCHINWHLEAGLGMTMIEARNVSQQLYSSPPVQASLTCATVGVNIS